MDVVLSYSSLFSAFSQFGHCQTGQGNITCYRHTGSGHAVYPLYMRNALWYNDSILPVEAAATQVNQGASLVGGSKV
jgi:hypothetical protein